MLMDPASLTPREIVTELDRYVVGQHAAKRAVAIALRNRYRRQRVEGEIKDEILPNNILMIGPTGVGKTEIARRLARLAQAPFLKVEASKFTEVGYVGRDVESMVRDLVELSIAMVRASHAEEVQVRAAQLVEERILDLLLPGMQSDSSRRVALDEPGGDSGANADAPPGAREAAIAEAGSRTRERFREMLRAGELDGRTIEVEVSVRTGSPVGIFAQVGIDDLDGQLSEAFESLLPKRTKRRKMGLGEARAVLLQEETARLIDMDQVVAEGIERVQQHGILFIDEIDKIVGGHGGGGPDVSREGVQRDLLPIVEGSNVSTKYGMIKTDHILFIAAGAFHQGQPSDLIPELQGRFPIRVELSALTEEDFVRILTEPRNALLKQYQALLLTEGVEVVFDAAAVRRIAGIAAQVNESTENIGARRLHTVLTTLLEELLFEVPEKGQGRVTIGAEMVERRLAPIMRDKDLSRFIL
jgi:ATP-dependent HslUV protease ATP-binding subunit HslU